MSLILRDYQKECIENIIKHFKTKDKQLIQLPTGAGKTIIFLSYLQKHSQSAIITVPTRDLQTQVYENAKRILGNQITLNPVKEKKPFCVITAASLNSENTYSSLSIMRPDTIVIDEAHHAQADTYRFFLHRYGQNHTFNLLGCTATPERLDRKCLLEIFDDITFSRNIYDMILQGNLCNIKGWRIETGCELKSDTNRHGEFKTAALKELDNETRNKILLKTYLEKCWEHKTLIFCIDIEHAEKINQLLLREGISSSVIHGKMSPKKRQETLLKFKTGEIQALTNCQLLTEGFDEPSITALIIARPTRSKSLYCQMIGRGLRNWHGKEFCYLYELADNNHNLCTFNTAAGHEPEFVYPYRDGITLIDLQKETSGMDMESLIIKESEMKLFEIENQFQNLHCTESQMRRLGMSLPGAFSAYEIGFLLWKNALKEKYGNNYFR